MRRNLLIGWATSVIFILFLGIIFPIIFGFTFLVNIMIPIEIGVISSVIPIIIIENSNENKSFRSKKKKSTEKRYRTLEEESYERISKDKKKKIDFDLVNVEEGQDTEREIFVLEDISPDGSDEDINIMIEEQELEDVKVDIPQKSSQEVVNDHFDTGELLRIFKETEKLDDIIIQTRNCEIHSFSPDFYDTMNLFKLTEEDQRDFIECMMYFTPSERWELLNKMKMELNS